MTYILLKRPNQGSAKPGPEVRAAPRAVRSSNPYLEARPILPERLGASGTEMVREGPLSAAVPATTDKDGTRIRPDEYRGPRRDLILAHEAVHRAQFAAFGRRPVGGTAVLEREAQEGASALLRGRRFLPAWSAPPTARLNFCPEGSCCEDEELSSSERQRDECRASEDAPSPARTDAEATSSTESLPSSSPSDRGGAPAQDQSWHTGGTFGSGVISGRDAHVRIRSYVEPARSLAKDLLKRVEAGELDHMSGRTMAVTGRNELLGKTRAQLSPGGRAFSKALKEEGRSLEALVARYTQRVVESDPQRMAQYGLEGAAKGSDDWKRGMRSAVQDLGDSPEVSREIIKAAGRSNKVVTGVARVSRVLGPVGSGLSLGLSSYEIVNAPEGERLHVASKELGGMAGGTLGAVAGGLGGAWMASLLCGPGAAVCGLIVSVAFVGGGGYAGGRAGEKVGSLLHGGLSALPMIMPVHTLARSGGFRGLMARDQRRFLRSLDPPGLQAARRIHQIDALLQQIEAYRARVDKQGLEDTRARLLSERNELAAYIATMQSGAGEQR